MKRFTKYLHNLRMILLAALFLVLALSITKNAIKIYAVYASQKTICVPILMYHQVKNTGLGKDVISPYEFEADLKYLSDMQYTTITMTELIDYVYNDTELPPNPIILTFDDGYLTTYKTVFPLLQKYNMKIVLSIVGKSVDDFSRVNDTNLCHAHITWDQVKEMQESGLVEIQNHTYNLHKICNGRYGCYPKANETMSHYEQLLTEDTLLMQEKVATVTGITPNTFTYPYGKYNNKTESIIKNLGFKATLSASYGMNQINKDPERLYGLKRICRSHNVKFDKLLAEAMRTLKYKKDL
jgi:peptidoglycan/xylan/chitin deacetylase (PgdA/CDA1 family)